MRRILAVLLILALTAPAAAGAEELTPAWMERAFTTRHVVGGAVIVSRYGETVFSYTYGSKNATRQQPVTLDTCFRIASVTKMVTAVGLMRLYDRGYFDLDAPLGDVLGFPVVNTFYRDDPITVRQALSHTTGLLASTPPQVNWAYVSERNTERLFKKYTRPGTAYQYSNANGGFFGSLIEALTGQSLNTYMSQNVFGPLGMNAAYAAWLLPDTHDISSRMNKEGHNIQSPSAAISAGDLENTCDPARHLTYSVGRLYVSANALNRLGMMLCNEGWLDGVRILSPYAVRLMQADQQYEEGSTVYCDSRYGLGMQRVQDSHGNTWYGHQGMIEGLSSDLFYLPEQGLVVTVIANGYTPLKYESDVLVALASLVMDRAVETDWDHYHYWPQDFQWAE